VKVEKITSLEEFKKRIANNKKPLVIEFGTDWSGTCQMLSKIIIKLMDIYENQIDYCHVDYKESKDIVEMIGVSYLPTYIFFKNGKVVDHFMGALPKRAIASKFNQLLGDNKIGH